MKITKWFDMFGKEHLLIEGKGNDVFHVIPNPDNPEADSFVQILSKQALIEFVAKVQEID